MIFVALIVLTVISILKEMPIGFIGDIVILQEH